MTAHHCLEGLGEEGVTALRFVNGSGAESSIKEVVTRDANRNLATVRLGKRYPSVAGVSGAIVEGTCTQLCNDRHLQDCK